jgi:SPP1 family predicted phage head-tail adaptor
VSLNAGKMRFRVVIQRPSDVQGDSGQPVDQWIVFASRRAMKELTAGSEHMVPQEQIARVPVLWKLRFLRGVTPKMRLLSDGKVYEILSAIDPDGMLNELHISSLERVGETP